MSKRAITFFALVCLGWIAFLALVVSLIVSPA
jgi:hypothetical protein